MVLHAHTAVAPVADPLQLAPSAVVGGRHGCGCWAVGLAQWRGYDCPGRLVSAVVANIVVSVLHERCWCEVGVGMSMHVVMYAR